MQRPRAPVERSDGALGRRRPARTGSDPSSRAELAPPSKGVEAAAEPPRVAALVCGLAIVAAALFYSTLLFGGSLHGYDWESHHYHYFD